MLLSNASVTYERVILVYIAVFQRQDELDWDIQEMSCLATSAGMQVINVLVNNRVVFNVKYCIGKGKLLDLQQMIKDSSASIVLFNHTLSSRQEQNLTCALQCKVIDRNQLILDIFAQRARTHEGKLQVKLAQLRYLHSRLTHEWSHLERQKGGIGLRSGPGEMQLESDRRVLRRRITYSISRLKKVENQREQSRNNRFKVGVPIVSLVGYTNAGKSTLFNVLTASSVYTTEKLFTTLDPTFRCITYQGIKSKIFLVDTVGFIQNLPNDLISSFKTTLKETMESTLLLHVVDAASRRSEKKINTVHNILNNMNIKDIPIILVMNKIDRFNDMIPRVDRDHDGRPIRIWMSAQSRLGISLLVRVLDELLLPDIVNHELRLPMNSDLCKTLYRLQVVQKYWVEDNGYYIRVKIYLPLIIWNRLLKKNTSLIDYII